jgi:hypothetical protein
VGTRQNANRPAPLALAGIIARGASLACSTSIADELTKTPHSEPWDEESAVMPYTVSDELAANACKHCAPMFILRRHVDMAPTAHDKSATLTFIKFRGRVYGITCKHVVTSLRDRIKSSGGELSYTFYVALKRHQVIQDRFFFPPGDWVTSPPDIAIRELHPDLPEHIGKVALDIEAHPTPGLSEISFAMAVGFPYRLKTQAPAPQGYQLAMPCAHAVAENRSITGPSFTLFSELQGTPEIQDLSGMSGGPIYWSNEASYGLLGVTYESSQIDGSVSGDASVLIRGHLADRETIGQWVSHVPHL